MRWTCLAIRPPRRFVAAPIPPLAGGCFSIPARINAAAGAPWKPAARSTRCSAIAKVDERLRGSLPALMSRLHAMQAALLIVQHHHQHVSVYAVVSVDPPLERTGSR